MMLKLCSVIIFTSTVISGPLPEKDRQSDFQINEGGHADPYQKRSALGVVENTLIAVKKPHLGVVENTLLAVKKTGTELKLNLAATKLQEVKKILLDPAIQKGSEFTLNLAATKLDELKKILLNKKIEILFPKL